VIAGSSERRPIYREISAEPPHDRKQPAARQEERAKTGSAY